MAAMQSLLILPGLGGGDRARARMLAWGERQPFAVHVPDYHRRAGFEATVEALADYIHAQRLDRVHNLSAFCFILGGWTLNRYLAEHDLPGLRTVVYDRSPYQERLAATFAERFPWIGRIRFGRLLRDFAATPYPPLPGRDRRVGLVVETRATRLARLLVRERDLSCDPLVFGQRYDDAIELPLDHDAMYTRFDEVVPDVVHFIRHGRFRPRDSGRS